MSSLSVGKRAVAHSSELLTTTTGPTRFSRPCRGLHKASVAPGRDSVQQHNAVKEQSTSHKKEYGTVKSISSARLSERAKKKALDRDVILSVLEASVNRRDAKGYLQKYTSPQPLAVSSSPQFVQGARADAKVAPAEQLPHVAIVKLRDPQSLDDETLLGIGKTLSQLRVLGLMSLIVIETGLDGSRHVARAEALRICEAIDAFARPGSKVLEDIFVASGNHSQHATVQGPSFLSRDLRVEDTANRFKQMFKSRVIPVIPSLARVNDYSANLAINSNDAVIALTKYLSGLQFSRGSPRAGGEGMHMIPKSAAIERVIVLDSQGGIPYSQLPSSCHRFVNLEQEYAKLIKELRAAEDPCSAEERPQAKSTTSHASNLTLVKEALSLLPETSSALITTPQAAANTTSTPTTSGFDTMITTRKKQNPLLHNLLTDKPVYSPSLPVERVRNRAVVKGQSSSSAQAATLVKRGMPLTIYPDPARSPWSAPQAGNPQLRLTDTCIDLPRLVHLIEDSFGRKLDVEHYLHRVHDKLAGVIIAGEYEGGAILTWEKPEPGSADSTDLVPYLDKFAVLKSRQGSGGVADVVFNAMVRDCFPGGVCWRSRKNNPVNKWYFERSLGTAKLSDSNWTMFWTTPGMEARQERLQDYEKVCRSVVPSWADKKRAAD